MGAAHQRTSLTFAFSVSVSTLIRREDDEIQFLPHEGRCWREKKLFTAKIFLRKLCSLYYLFVCLLLSILGFYGGDGAGVCIE